MSRPEEGGVCEQVRQQLFEKRRQLQRLTRLQQPDKQSSNRPGRRLYLLLASATTVAGAIGGLPFLLLLAGLSAGVLLVRTKCAALLDVNSTITQAEARQQQLQREIEELESRLRQEALLG